MDQKLIDLRLKNAIKHIDLVLEDTKSVSQEEFKKSDLLCRADAFSLAQIGEQLKRLQEFFEKDHPEIPWHKANALRNMVVHDYHQVNFEDVYLTIKNDILPLREQLIKLLA